MLFANICLHVMTPAGAEELTDGKVVVVAVVEPRDVPVKEGELDHMVSIGESRLVTPSSVLNGLGRSLADNQSTRLAILLHKDISVGTLSELISLAGKAGYDGTNINIFIYSSTRWMMPIPGYKIVAFTRDPTKLADIVN